MEAAATEDTVRLSVPARLEYLRIVRLTASGIASRLGFDVDEIDSLRVAIDELANIVVDAAAPGRLDLSFATVGNQLCVEGRAPLAPGVEVAIDDLTELILKAVTDDYELHVTGSNALFRCALGLPGT